MCMPSVDVAPSTETLSTGSPAAPSSCQGFLRSHHFVCPHFRVSRSRNTLGFVSCMSACLVPFAITYPHVLVSSTLARRLRSRSQPLSRSNALGASKSKCGGQQNGPFAVLCLLCGFVDERPPSILYRPRPRHFRPSECPKSPPHSSLSTSHPQLTPWWRRRRRSGRGGTTAPCRSTRRAC